MALTSHVMSSIAFLSLIVAIAAPSGCRQKAAAPLDVAPSHTNEQIRSSAYPVATDPKKVGTYPALAKSGGGYFYDDVLEYRVWITPRSGGDDHFEAFATYEEAEHFAQRTTGSEKPLVLVRQFEHVNEPRKGVYEHVKGERLTEWVPAWLKGTKRGEDSIAKFLANPRPIRSNEDK